MQMHTAEIALVLWTPMFLSSSPQCMDLLCSRTKLGYILDCSSMDPSGVLLVQMVLSATPRRKKIAISNFMFYLGQHLQCVSCWWLWRSGTKCPTLIAHNTANDTDDLLPSLWTIFLRWLSFAMKFIPFCWYCFVTFCCWLICSIFCPSVCPFFALLLSWIYW